MQIFFNKLCLFITEHKKKLLALRNTLFIVLISSFQVLAGIGYAQITRLSLDLKNSTVKQVLQLIEQKSEFYFLYNSELIDVQRKVDIVVINEKIDVILTKLFHDEKVEVLVRDRHIVLTPLGENTTQQPQKQINGKVTDQSGLPIPGASVVVKGTTTGVTTNNDGNFTLTLPIDAKILSFSFVGMKMQEIAIGNRTLMNVVLADESIGIEEVVAIGYGNVRKRDLTGAVVSVKMKDANLNANTSVMQALQGSVPGLNIGQVTKAGEDPSLKIRGYTSLSAGQTPLIVVDGVIFSGSISDLNTSDIDRIDVLKDASSAAVYGSRSANGVIIITTKRGTSDIPTFNFNTYHGVQQMAHKVQMAGGVQYAQKILDFRSATGLEADPAKIENYLQPLEIENYRNKTYTDWFDLLTQTAPIDQYDLSVSGKTSKTNYYLSGSHTSQKGVVIGDDFKRTTLRANFSNDITDWLTIGMNTSYSHRDYSGQAVDFTSNAAFASPLSTVYSNKATGELNLYPHNDMITINPLSWEKGQDAEIQDNLFATLFADIKIPKVEGLKFHFDYSNNLQFYKHNLFWGLNTSQGINAPNGLAIKSSSEMRNWSINNILSYSRKFKKHAVDATVLYSREGAQGESTDNTAKGFSTTALGWNSIELGNVQIGNSGAWGNSSEAFMARLNYVFNLRYLLTATYRRDGFSGFAKGNKYANFPSVSLGWVISEENFAKSQKWLSYLKLRTSYGINGNQALGSYGSLSQMSTLNYVYGDGGNASIGIFPNSLSNSNLTWEKTSSLNLGLDFGIFDGRISGELNIYQGTTRDLLVKRSLPSMTGYTNVWTNLGELDNKGIEVALTTVNVSATDFRWETKFSFSLNRNKIAQLYGADANKDGKEDDDIGNSWFIGKSIGALYDYTLDGIYQLTDTNIPTGFKAGTFRLKDVNGDTNITPDDRSVIGYSVPNYRVSIFNELKYKDFSLSFMINSVQGGNNYYMINNVGGLSTNNYFSGAAGRVNIPNISYWTPTNASNTVPRIDYSPKYAHGIYEDRSFVRLQDVTLAYNFDTAILTKLKVTALKVYVSAKNLYTWTKFTGWDPEAGTEIGGGYPVMRSIVAGLNINF